MVKSKPSPPSKWARVCRVSIWEAQTSGGGPWGPPARAHAWRGDTVCLWAHTHFASRTARVNEDVKPAKGFNSQRAPQRVCFISLEHNVDRAEAAKRLRARRPGAPPAPACGARTQARTQVGGVSALAVTGCVGEAPVGLASHVPSCPRRPGPARRPPEEGPRCWEQVCGVEQLCGAEAGASLVSGRDRGKWRPCPRPGQPPQTPCRQTYPNAGGLGLQEPGGPPALALAERTCQDVESHVPSGQGPGARDSGPRRARRSPPASSRPQTYARRRRPRSTVSACRPFPLQPLSWHMSVRQGRVRLRSGVALPSEMGRSPRCQSGHATAVP